MTQPTITTIRNKTTNIYTEWLPLIEGLTNENAGQLFKDILKYQSGGVVDSNISVWIFIKNKIDDYNKNSRNTHSVRAKAGRSGGLAKASKAKQKLAKPSKPSIKEKKRKEKKIKDSNIHTVKGVEFSLANEKFIDDVWKFKRIVESSGRLVDNANFNEWASQLRLLFGEVGEKRYYMALNWYAKNIGKQYIPECFSAISFRKKFNQIANQIIREEKRNG